MYALNDFNLLYVLFIGGFQTLPLDVTQINIAVVSCDNDGVNSGVNMWEKLWHKITRESVHIVLHIGDNVYIDGDSSHYLSNKQLISDLLFTSDKINQDIPYVKARNVLRNLSKDKWQMHAEEICEIYREKYRATWNLPFKAKVLSHVSNLMILDDHEVRDDYGSLPEDSDPEHQEFFLGTQAIKGKLVINYINTRN